MMMIVDISAVEENFIDVVTELEEIGKKLGVEVHCQKEEIFTKMHRICKCQSCVATEQFVGIVSTIIHKQERGKFL